MCVGAPFAVQQTTKPRPTAAAHSDRERESREPRSGLRPTEPQTQPNRQGFIRAETIGYGDFLRHGGYSGAKEAGALRLEGKEYVVQEGDVLLFRFNV